MSQCSSCSLLTPAPRLPGKPLVPSLPDAPGSPLYPGVPGPPLVPGSPISPRSPERGGQGDVVEISGAGVSGQGDVERSPCRLRIGELLNLKK